MRHWYRTASIRVGRLANREFECWQAEGETTRLPPVGIIVIGDNAGGRHGDGWDGDLDLLTLTLDVTTARDIGVDLLEDGRGRSGNDLRLNVGVTWLHAGQEARRGRGVDGEILGDVVGEDVNELIGRRGGSVLLSIITPKVGVDLELQLGFAALGDEGLEKVGDWLLGLAEGLDQVDREVLVAIAVERGGEAAVADASGATWEGCLLVGRWRER